MWHQCHCPICVNCQVHIYKEPKENELLICDFCQSHQEMEKRND